MREGGLTELCGISGNKSGYEREFSPKKGVRIRGYIINHYWAPANFGIKSANQVGFPISSSTSSTFKPFIIARLLSPSSVASCIEIPPAAAIPV